MTAGVTDPSPQAIVAEKSPSGSAGLPLVNVATTPLNGAPALAATWTAAADSGASAISAVLSMTVELPPTSFTRMVTAYVPRPAYALGAAATTSNRPPAATTWPTPVVWSPQSMVAVKSLTGAFGL